MTAKCWAYGPDGRICGRPAVAIDEDRGFAVCELHQEPRGRCRQCGQSLYPWDWDGEGLPPVLCAGCALNEGLRADVRLMAELRDTLAARAAAIYRAELDREDIEDPFAE